MTIAAASLTAIARVPMNDLARRHARFAEATERAVVETLRSGWWLNGERTRAFAENFANFIGARHCVLAANGTDALELALRALAATDPGRDEVVTVANAGGYSTTAIRSAGLVPVYADIEEASHLVSPASAASCISERTLAMVATHLYGGVVDVGRLREALAGTGRAGLAILEDCAQAHGARLDGRRVGSLGEIAAFSFYPTKNLGAAGDAGAVTTGSDRLAEMVRALAQYGWDEKYRIARPGGRNSRIDELQAAILDVQLGGLDSMNAERSDIRARYIAAAGTGIDFVAAGEGSVTHLAVVGTDRREALKTHLAARGIASEIHYPVLDCDQPGWRAQPHRLAPDGLAVTRRQATRILTIPCFNGMTEAEIARVCDALSGFTAP